MGSFFSQVGSKQILIALNNHLVVCRDKSIDTSPEEKNQNQIFFKYYSIMKILFKTENENKTFTKIENVWFIFFIGHE